MIKYLLLLVGVVGGFMWWSKQRRMQGPKSAEQVRASASAAAATPTGAKPANMVSCAHCGVHLPESEALVGAQSLPYCSEAHRLAGPRARS